MGDEILRVLNEQLQQEHIKLLSQKRLDAYKFFNSAYIYTGDRADLAFDAWEYKLSSALNRAVGLSNQATRDEMRRELAYARSVMEIRYASNPEVTDLEQRIFDMVESFSMAGELA
jgi:hypothetical protein